MNKTHQLYFLGVFLIAIFAVIFLIFRPFLYTLLLAVTFAVIFWPVHERVLNFTRGRKALAAFLTTIGIVLFILTPIAIIGLQVFQEAWQLYASLAQDGKGNAILDAIKNSVDQLRAIIPIPIQISVDIDQYLKQGLVWLIEHFGILFSSLAQFALHSFLFIVSFYYLLKDGTEIRRNLITLSPLPDSDDEVIFNKLHRAINSVVKGSLLVALIQGAFTGIGFMIFGIPNPILWSTVAAITALIPAVGTSLVVIPACVFLFLNGNTSATIGLLIWGLFIVGLIDNLLRPKLVERGIQIHPLLILLSALGGIIFFGPTGFLLGPLTLSLLFALVETYFSLAKKSPHHQLKDS